MQDITQMHKLILLGCVAHCRFPKCASSVIWELRVAVDDKSVCESIALCRYFPTHKLTQNPIVPGLSAPWRLLLTQNSFQTQVTLIVSTGMYAMYAMTINLALGLCFSNFTPKFSFSTETLVQSVSMIKPPTKRTKSCKHRNVSVLCFTIGMCV